MSPQVVAAVIAARVSGLTLIGTLAAQLVAAARLRAAARPSRRGGEFVMQVSEYGQPPGWWITAGELAGSGDRAAAGGVRNAR